MAKKEESLNLFSSLCEKESCTYKGGETMRVKVRSV